VPGELADPSETFAEFSFERQVSTMWKGDYVEDILQHRLPRLGRRVCWMKWLPLTTTEMCLLGKSW